MSGQIDYPKTFNDPLGLGPRPGAPEFEPSDPWKHRSKGMKCRTCMWFVVKAADGARDKPEQGAVGRCRRRAPTMNGFPVVFERDWCGDHRLDENKA